MGPKSRDATLELQHFYENAAVGQKLRIIQMFFFLLHPSKQPEPQISPAPHVRLARTLWYREW